MPTAFVYRRALRRFATCIVFTMFNLVVCDLMIHWVAERKVSPALLLLIVPLALTLASMSRCTLNDLERVGAAISAADTETARPASAQV